VLDIEPAVDTAVAVNGFYPHEFVGENVTGWDTRPLSIITAGSQVRTCQQAQLAREHLARLRRQAQTMLIEPVPYHKVAGTDSTSSSSTPASGPGSCARDARRCSPPCASTPPVRSRSDRGQREEGGRLGAADFVWISHNDEGHM